MKRSCPWTRVVRLAWQVGALWVLAPGCGKGAGDSAGPVDTAGPAESGDLPEPTDSADSGVLLSVERFSGPGVSFLDWVGGGAAAGAVLVGQPFGEGGAGTVYLLGTDGGPDGEPAWLERAALATFHGVQSTDFLGREGVVFESGATVVVLRGQTAELEHDLSVFYDPSGTVTEDARDAWFLPPGGSVGPAGAADVDGDGRDDLLVPFPFTSAGSLVCWFAEEIAGSVDWDSADACAAGEVDLLPGPPVDVDNDGHLDLALAATVGFDSTVIRWVSPGAVGGEDGGLDSEIASIEGPYAEWPSGSVAVQTDGGALVAWPALAGAQPAAGWLVPVEPGGVVDAASGTPLHGGETTPDDLILAALPLDGGVRVVSFEGSEEGGGQLLIESFDAGGAPLATQGPLDFAAPGPQAFGAFGGGVLGLAQDELIWIAE